jgi:hypothetical protein
VIITSRRRRLELGVAAAAAVAGLVVAIHYARIGLTLSHYDARGHLIVARRLFDSLTPGWQQIGAVWLPLPHLLNALPVQVDAFYRTGASAVAISIAAFALASTSLASTVCQLTRSAPAALAAVAVFALNANVLYLQSTPMTEPLLIALLLFGLARLVAATRPGPPPDRRNAALAGGAFALACLTRYEAWPVTAAALSLAAAVRWRSGDPLKTAVRTAAEMAVFPAIAVAAFLILSRVVGGAWFASGFFVPENEALGRPAEALRQIGWGVRELSGPTILALGAGGLIAAAAGAAASADRARWALPLALVAAAGVPWLAFVQGHPYRIRYMVPLIAAEAVGVGLLAGLLPRWRPAAALCLAAVAALELRPLDRDAPMVAEAQWDRPNVAARAPVTACLRAGYEGDAIMASMGSLGHYMQELSRDGFRVRDFLHEGNGDVWLIALEGARPYAGWVLIEDKAEGGDMLARIARENPRFLAGFSRVCEGAGLVLYKRAANPDLDAEHAERAERADRQLRRPAGSARSTSKYQNRSLNVAR